MKISDRPVACARMLVGVAMSESTNEELALTAPSTMLTLGVSTKLDTLSTTEADNILEGTSVAEEKAEILVMPSEEVTGRVDISACESKVIDGTTLASEIALAGIESDTTMPLLDAIENMDETSWVEKLISTGSDPVSRGSEATVVNADRSDKVLDGSSVVKVIISEITLERTLVAEETIDTSVI